MAATLGTWLSGSAVRSSSAALSGAQLAERAVCPSLGRPAAAPLQIVAKDRWDRPEMLPSGRPVRQKIHVKTGDTVQVIAGKDKGKVAEVQKVYLKTSQIICKDVNVKIKHNKPAREGETGQITSKEYPIHSSNVQHYSVEKGVRSRIGQKIDESGKKVRYLIKTGEVLKESSRD